MSLFHQIMTSIQVVGFRMERLNYLSWQWKTGPGIVDNSKFILSFFILNLR